MLDATSPSSLVVAETSNRVDFSTVAYPISTIEQTGIEPIKGKADMGIWRIYSDWTDTYLKSRGIKYMRTETGRYADYMSIKSVVESVGYDGCRALAASYWQADRWSRFEKTISRFAHHATAIYESLQRDRRNKE